MPSNRSGVLCWCNSGLTYDECHRDRDKQIAIKPHEAVEKFRKAFSQKYCMHPENSLTTCSRRIVKAHSISSAVNLGCIAENGHVMHFGFPLSGAIENWGRLVPLGIGVNRASTFTGFCQLHDSRTFVAIDQPIESLTTEHLFLLGYRAVCRELFTKNAAFVLNRLARELDKGKDQDAQREIQRFCAARELGLTAGLADLRALKDEFDQLLLNQTFDTISAYIIELDHAPQIVCSVGFSPEVDFDGNRLQSLHEMDQPVDTCTCSIINTRRGGAIVFVWLRERNGACSGLVDSLDRMRTHLVPNAIVRLVFEHGENVFFSKSWWEDLDDGTKTKLEERANSFYDKHAQVLRFDYVRPVLWSVVNRRRYQPTPTLAIPVS